VSGHVPVLLQEVVSLLKPRKGKTIADCTVGLGGHAAALRKKGARVIGLDLDPANLARVTSDIELHHANFAALPTVLAGTAVDGILADLGVSSPHVDDPARGFSYRESGPLDMRLDPTRGRPASALLDSIGREELASALRDLGDEEEAERVAEAIVARRPLRTTLDLAAAVCEAKGFTLRRAAGAKLHPAARSFQAVRMLVNRETANLERLLAVLPMCLKPKGIAAIISFHSGEDRRVKHAFREGLRSGVYDRGSEDPVVPGPEEEAANPRSRSAKLRWVRRSATSGAEAL
jgi:16S rRNA (cytosine1402-N4)-methyltransferase